MKSWENVAEPVLHEGFQVIAFFICRVIRVCRCATFLSISAGVSSLVDGEAGLASSWLWREMA